MKLTVGLIVTIGFLAVFGLTAPKKEAKEAKEAEEVAVGLPSGRKIQAELAVTQEQRARGLMFRDSLAADRGMLFVFPAPDFHGFWMKNCRFPIDIIWLSSEKKIVHIERAVPPCKEDPCPTYGPMRKAQYVLEVVADFSRKEKLQLGDAMEFKTP